MSFRRVNSVLMACCGAAALLTATVAANAGGLAVREQSAWGLGSSFAGVAAGGSLSAMFWNPATMTQQGGIQSESVLTGISLYNNNNPGAGSTLAGVPFSLGFGSTGDTATDAVIPASYFSYQITPQLWAGLSVNAPFGLAVSFPTRWAGLDYAAGSSYLKTYNFTPSLAYAINNWISVGVGLQVQYGKADLSRGATAGVGVYALSELSGSGWAYGWTAGVTLTPTPATTIGIGYRSALNQKIEGSVALTAPLAGFSNPDVHTTVNLPGMLSVGLKQKLNSQWTLLGTVEWTNWSRIGTSNVLTAAGGPVLVAGTPVQVHFDYKDGWFFSLGGEYQWNTQLALRAGIAYEISPISDQVRVPLLPDNDRVWLSVGATYQWTPKLSFDFAYSHIFVKNTPINVVAGNPTFNGTISYIGTADAHADVVSVAIKYRWDDPVQPAKVGYFKAK